MEWLKKLGAAIDYIEDNLDKEISYDEAACIACCSPYYFQRVFSYVSGVSLAEYIRRRKMTQAAFELQRADSRVIDVALKYGYSSPTSFNRAFQNVHGITPTAAKLGGEVSCKHIRQFSLKLKSQEEALWHIALRKSAPAYCGHPYPFDFGYGRKFKDCSRVLESVIAGKTIFGNMQAV